MSATRILETPDSRLWLSRQAIILRRYLPSVLLIVLSIGWVVAVNAAPEGVSVFLLITLIQLALFASIVDVLLQKHRFGTRQRTHQ